MAGLTKKVKKRVVFLLGVFTLVFFLLAVRLFQIQIVDGAEYQQKAMEQWTRDVPVPSKRGIIYDRNGKELATNAPAYEIYVRPVEVEEKETTAQTLAEILNMDKEDLLEKVSAKKDTVIIKKKVDSDTVKILREKNIKGLIFVDDSKRFYPQSNFASYILGFTNYDNQGQDGVEATFEKYLNGFPGRDIKMTDAQGRELPESDRKYYEPQDGLNLILTIDEVIQHFAEKAVENALIETQAKRVMAIVMEPKTGDILAMAIKPDYDNNNPREVPEDLADEWDNMSSTEQYNALFKIWRNPAISDTYEPGSTFKTITTAAGLEEGVVKPEDRFYCSGSVLVAGRRLKCWRSYNPHGSQTFIEAVQNSCNPVFIEVGQRLGKENFYKYIKGFGFGTPTNIKLLGEASGIVRNIDSIGPVELANISFGQGISITPIQLITAVSAIVNDGYLMEPRIAKKLIDNEGNTIHEFQPRVVRQVISKETSATMRQILESVVTDGSGRGAYIPGYKVGGKTGTAQKAEGGRYVSGKYVSSFVGFAPSNDPRITVLVVIDEPGGGSYYGGVIATPVVKNIISDTLRYLDVKPQYTEEEAKQLMKEKVIVPEVRNMKLKDAIKLLEENKLKYRLEEEQGEPAEDSLVLDQTPRANAKVNEGSVVIIYAKPKE
ncbi:MAG: stage V sporulation protein D [Clostridiales bacterium]|nr:stage V sporulation protein D [Clostridiales bacterium]